MRKILFTLILILSFAISKAQDYADFEDNAFKYYDNEQYERAAKKFIKATQKYKEEFGIDYTYAELYGWIAYSYEDANNTEKALKYYVEAINLSHNIEEDKENTLYASYCSGLGGLYYNIGNYAEAEPLLIEAISIFEKQHLKDDLGYSTSLNNLAEIYRVMGNYDKALSLLLKVLENIEMFFGKEHPDYGTSLNNLASLYQDIGSYDKALTLYLEALENAEMSLGKEHPEYGTSLNNLAVLYEIMGKYDKALFLCFEALENIEKSLGKEHPFYGTELNNIAFLYDKMGDYNRAILLYLESLANIEKSLGKEDPSYSDYSSNLAGLYQRIGSYDKALTLYLEALENAEMSLGKEHPKYGTSLSNLGNLYQDIGNYDKALTLYLEALRNTEKSLGKEHLDYSICLSNLASLYQDIGSYDKALAINIEVLKNIEKSLGKEHPNYGAQLNDLAVLYITIGSSTSSKEVSTKNYNKALPLCIEALENTEKSLGKEHLEYGIQLNNLAVLYITIGNSTSSKEISWENYDKALPLSLEALKICENSVGKEHSLYGLYLNSLVELYKRKGITASSKEISWEYYNQALPLSLESLKNCKNSLGKDHQDYGNSLGQLAGLYESMGNHDKALPLYIEEIKNTNRNINKTFTFLSEKEKEAYLQTVSNNFEKFNSFALLYKNKFSNITTYVFDNTLTNKGILLKSGTAMRTAVLNSNDTTLINKFKEWTLLNKQIAHLYSTEINKRYQDPKELEDKATLIERDLVSSSQEFSSFNETQNTKWKNVQASLNPNEAAIEFINFDFHNKNWTDTTYYCALLLKPNNNYPEMIPLFTESEYNNCINYSNNLSSSNLVAQLYGKKRGTSVLTSGIAHTNYADSLYSLIWNKIDPYLDGVETVYYSPSGLLHNISFSAIPYNDTLLLSDKYELVYMASTGNLVNRKPEKNINDFTIALYGGLNYDIDTVEMLVHALNFENSGDDLLAMQRSINVNNSTRGGSWNYLQGTLDEVENIKSMFDNNDIFTIQYSGSEGVEESFKSLAGRNSPEIIHLATHGFFFPDPEKKKMENNDMLTLDSKQVFRASDNPLIRSGLILSGANRAWNNQTIPDGIDDGILTAYEVSGLDLYNTELVVLSACETGLGDIKGSEGVYGLQRSFKMAGVDYLVMSLWQVPDKETSEFMQLFYQNLLKEQSIGIAFRNAQKVMKNKYDPYYWAAFVLIE